MAYLFSLSNLLVEHRSAVISVIIMTLIESLLYVAQFYFIGRAINDLLNQSWSGIFVLCALFIGKLIISYLKQVRISKSYKVIYDALLTERIGQPLAEGEEHAKLTPKSAIIYAMTECFKGDLIKGLESIIRLVLVLIILFILNKIVFVLALILGVIVVFLYFIQRKQTIHISRLYAEELNREYGLLEMRDPSKYFEHQKKMEGHNRGLLRISAINLSIIEFLSFGFLLLSLIILVNMEGENALGTFFTMLYYVLAFSEVMFVLPSVYQRFLKVEELSKTV